jgi:nicotinamide-nucleotide amidase
VITTGGLGPTQDDITHEAVASYAGVERILDEHEVQVLRDRFASMCMTMPDSNLRQAEIPAGARVLPNDLGTAPGIALETGAGWIVTLPGIPREMKHMLVKQAIPLLRDRWGMRGAMKVRVLKTFGYTESRLASVLRDVPLPDPGLRIGYRPRFPEIHVSLTASAPDERAADDWLAGCEAALAERLGAHLWGADDDELAGVVLELMRAGGHTLATAESCTGGLVSKLLTDIPGSSDVFDRGFVTYTNEAKMELLDVPPALLEPGGPGAVSEECVLYMARGALERSGASHALSISGIAGPGGGTEDKPVGTVWIALATPEGSTARRYEIPGTRGWVRTLSAHIALDRLRRHLLRLPDEERWVER